MDKKLVFIIAHKYVRGYNSYLSYYIDNLLNFYDNPTIIIVDNNSINKNDIFKTLPKLDNIILLDNFSESKFELGAYLVGITYLMENKLLNHFDYFIFTQDNYIMKNKYEFSNICQNASSLIGWQNDMEKMDVVYPVLSKLNLMDSLEKTHLCWCNSFVIKQNKIQELKKYLDKITIKTRHESEGSERYLGRIFLELNNGGIFNIDGSDNNFIANGISYDCHHINPYDNIDKYFCKISQQKNERTQE